MTLDQITIQVCKNVLEQLPSDSPDLQDVISNLKRIVAGEELPREEINKLQDYFRTVSGLFDEEWAKADQPTPSCYDGPRKCPVCGKDYRGGPHGCPQGCNPQYQK